MTGLRQKALLLALTAGIVAAAAPASASFQDSGSVATAITTETIAPPTNLVGNLTCPSKGDAVMSATWTASASPDVTGYLLEVTFSDGFVQPVQLAANATSWSAPIQKYTVTVLAVQYTVTTQTSDGWTASTPATGWFKC